MRSSSKILDLFLPKISGFGILTIHLCMKLLKKIKIFTMAVVGYSFWRVRYADGAISKLMSFWSSIDVMLFNHGSYVFIDFSTAEGLV